MEETDPAPIEPGKKQVVETAAPGSAGSAPMVSPLGMPMSPNTPGDGFPAERFYRGDDVLALDTPSQDFGSPAMTGSHHVLSHDVLPAQELPQGYLVEGRVAGHAPMARTLPAHDSCSCCGQHHEGRETRRFDGDDHEPDHHHHNTDDQPPTHHAVHEGKADTDASTTDPCSCCGDHHPGLDDKGRSGDSSTPGNTDDHSHDKSDKSDKSDDSDGCSKDDDKDDKHDKHDRNDKHGHDKHDKHDRDDKHGHDKHDHRPDDSSKDHRGHHGKHDPHDGSDPGLPPTSSHGKVPGGSTPGGHPLSPHQPSQPGKPTTPAEAPGGYAVDQGTKPQAPRGTMAPPLAEKSSPLSPNRGTPPKESSALKPSIPGAQGAPLGSRVPAASGGSPQTPLMPVTSGVPATHAPAGQAPGSQAPGGQSPGEAPPTNHNGTPGQTQEAPQLFSRSANPNAQAPANGAPGTVPPPAQYQPAGQQSQTQPGQTTEPQQLRVATQGTPANGNGAFNLPGTQGYGGNTGPQNGNVGPDPNVKFDEASYLQLIGVVADVSSTLDDAASIDVTYLDAELKLQPSGQTWEPAVNLVTRGGRFGGSVDTETTHLAKTLSTFHTALESAKEVFKETDDLAAYDASKFTTEYPGFNSGGLPGSV